MRPPPARGVARTINTRLCGRHPASVNHKNSEAAPTTYKKSGQWTSPRSSALYGNGWWRIPTPPGNIALLSEVTHARVRPSPVHSPMPAIAGTSP
jgi:hypothetical protein